MKIDLTDTQQTDNGMDIDLNIADEGTPPQPTHHIDRLKKATRTSARHLQEVSFTRHYMKAREKRFGRRKKKKKEPKGKERAEPDDIAMEDDEGQDDEDEQDDDEGQDDEQEGEEQMSPSKTASDHMKIISEPKNSPMAARTLDDVARIATLRREAAEPIRTIQSSKRLQNLHHTQEIQKKASKTKAAAKLKEAIEDHSLAHPDPLIDKVSKVNGSNGYCKPCRQHHPPTMCNTLSYPDQCPKSKPDNITVFAYGSAGSGVGSRIGGHLRWGGNWMRQELLRLGLVVALTDEYCTSRICVYCFQRLQLQKSRRLVGTAVKTRTVHGSVVCVNPQCPAVMEGYATRPRDTNAAVGILLSAASVMLNKDEDAAPWPLLPYSRYARPRGVPAINTGANDPDQEHPCYEQMEATSSAIMAAVGSGQTTGYVVWCMFVWCMV